MQLLKGRTGLTPNVLSRIAFSLSIREPFIPKQDHDTGGQEFNRYTLTGQWDVLFMALIKEKMIEEGIYGNQDLVDFFRAHIENGITLLYNRVKCLSDFVDLLLANKAEKK